MAKSQHHTDDDSWPVTIGYIAIAVITMVLLLVWLTAIWDIWFVWLLVIWVGMALIFALFTRWQWRKRVDW